jgi:hypothetical protein
MSTDKPVLADGVTTISSYIPEDVYNNDEFLREMADDFRKFCRAVSNRFGVTYGQAQHDTLEKGLRDHPFEAGVLLHALGKFPDPTDTFILVAERVRTVDLSEEEAQYVLEHGHRYESEGDE